MRYLRGGGWLDPWVSDVGIKALGNRRVINYLNKISNVNSFIRIVYRNT